MAEVRGARRRAGAQERRDGRVRAAADAIVAGSEAELRRLLDANPWLVHARSTREHRSTLLHHVAANGVEGWRQVTPENIVAVARILLDAGAEVDAESDVSVAHRLPAATTVATVLEALSENP